MRTAVTPRAQLPLGSYLDDTATLTRVAGRGATRDADESYRKAALFLSNMVAEGSHAVLLCSARHREGTTTAVLNLAHELQDSYGLRALVMELPRRKPVLAKLFALNPEQTLERALTRSAPVADCIQVTSAGLSVIAGGRHNPGTTPARLGPRLQEVLREVEDLADIVLIDAPPLLVQADALIAGTVVPQVVLVVESGRTDYDTLDRVKRELATEGVGIAGTILVKHQRFIPRWIDWWLNR